ncbi:cobyrinate a,c-diamide synthase [Butyrivibrio sp. AE3006]|uniref:cobyrinate a,c-diamide synthase n=1 Tax=Butyrivibrio sp. AE3006 TaxID=1280673 RepID=UPI000409B86A|nr:cobyrinate a,c-diamide synthase [Butyrivibrio sp. AE3006]
MGNNGSFRRLMICAPASGSGKTLITCALLRILQRKGFKPASFKCGPDYIDPMFHKRMLGIPSRNLDIFLAGEEGVKRTLCKGAEERDFGILEGVMGFYDGSNAATTEGSSYEISCVTDTPAILVVNCRGMSNSIIPLIKGFAEYGHEKRIRGVILNNISPMIAGDISNGILENTGIPVLGTVPVLKDVKLESRHLGLVMPSEVEGVLAIIDKVADALMENLDFEKLVEIADSAGSFDDAKEGNTFLTYFADKNLNNTSGIEVKNPIRIGIARDEAFCFYYEDNLDLLCEMGAELVPFSPIHDEKLPEVSHLIIGGGYPELYAKELSENKTMIESLKTAADSGMPILAECGGFLYLQESMQDPEGAVYPMAGVLSGKSHMRDKLSHFGYVKVTKIKDNPYIQDGEEIRAHEFHYYDTTENGDICKMTKPSGKRSWEGYRVQNKVFAGFAHLYYPSCMAFIRRFLDA